MKKIIEQILKFGVVGFLAFLVDYSVLFILTEFVGVHYLVSGAISFSASVVFNYILSIIWVFEVKEDQNKIYQFIIFVILSVIGLLINQLIIWLLVEKLAIYYMIAKIVATAVVMVYNFVTRKLIIEKHQ